MYCSTSKRVDDNDRRYFAFFESWEYFLMWYKRLPPNERKFLEVISEGPQKFTLLMFFSCFECFRVLIVLFVLLGSSFLGAVRLFVDVFGGIDGFGLDI